MVGRKAVDSVTEYLKKRKIANKVDQITTDLVESLAPYLQYEGTSEEAQQRVVRACIRVLQPLVDNPEGLLRGSLDPERVFWGLHPGGKVPEDVADVEQVYTLVARQVCAVLCQVPGAVEGWELAGWRENYRRLDEIVERVKQVTEKIDERERVGAQRGDRLLAKIRQLQEQRARLNLTGLRADRPIVCPFDEVFVEPEVTRFSPDGRWTRTIVLTLDSMLATRARHLIFGAPGAGKSTWCQWVGGRVATQEDAQVTVLIRLREIEWDAPPSLLTRVRALAGPHLADQVTPELFATWAERGSLGVLVDGFDEVAPDRRPDAARWLRELAIAADRCPVVVTSRPIATDELEALTEPWSRGFIEDFDEERVVRFIQNWNAHAWPRDAGGPEINAEVLANEWNKDPTIAPLTGNPLLLSTLLLVHKLDGSLPHGRAELYRRYVHGMIGFWAQEVATPGVTLNAGQKRAVLADLALHMHLGNVDELDELATLAIVQGALSRIGSRDDPRAVLRALRERTGLLDGSASIAFVHKSIGEYLVAEVTMQGDRSDAGHGRVDRMRLLQERHNDRWRTVMFLWAGMAPLHEVTSFLDLIASTQSEADTALLGGLLIDQVDRIPSDVHRTHLESMLLGKYRTRLQIGGSRTYGGFRAETGGFVMFTSISRQYVTLTDYLARAFRRNLLDPTTPPPGLKRSFEEAWFIALGSAKCFRLSTIQVYMALPLARSSEWFDWMVAEFIGTEIRAGSGTSELIAAIQVLAGQDPFAYAAAALAAIHIALDRDERRPSALACLAAGAGFLDELAVPSERLEGSRETPFWYGGDPVSDERDILQDLERELTEPPVSGPPEQVAPCLVAVRTLLTLRDGARANS